MSRRWARIEQKICLIEPGGVGRRETQSAGWVGHERLAALLGGAGGEFVGDRDDSLCRAEPQPRTSPRRRSARASWRSSHGRAGVHVEPRDRVLGPVALVPVLVPGRLAGRRAWSAPWHGFGPCVLGRDRDKGRGLGGCPLVAAGAPSSDITPSRAVALDVGLAQDRVRPEGPRRLPRRARGTPVLAAQPHLGLRRSPARQRDSFARTAPSSVSAPGRPRAAYPRRAPARRARELQPAGSTHPRRATPAPGRRPR